MHSEWAESDVDTENGWIFFVLFFVGEKIKKNHFIFSQKFQTF